MRNKGRIFTDKEKTQGKTIAWVVKNGLCTGCGTCVSLCPSSAISLNRDTIKEIYLPKVDVSQCNQCGICFKVCPGFQVDFKNLNISIFGQEPRNILLGNYTNCYQGHSTDFKMRYNASSGGLVPALLTFALEQKMIDGVLVTKMREADPLEPQPFIARTKEEIFSAMVSKYCPVPANIALKEILETPGKYAVVGLPCHLQGIRKAEKVNRKLKEKVVLHVGIFCAASRSFLATQFQLHRMGIRKEEVSKIQYRGEGWPGSLIVQLKNGQRRIIGSDDYYDDLFCSFTPRRCSVCVDHTSELADVSFGDAWLPDVKANDKVGTSIVISRSNKVDEILHEMVLKARIEMITTDAERVTESQAGFINKKRDSGARLNILKLCGIQKPNYTCQFIAPSFFQSYLVNGVLYYSKLWLASKRYLWWLLNTLVLTQNSAGYLKSKIWFR